MTNASAELSAATRARSGMVTLSRSAWVSTPKGPSLSVTQSISGPPSNNSGCSAFARLRVTCSFEFGLITRIFLTRAVCHSLSRRHYCWKVRRVKAFQSQESPLSNPAYDLVIRNGTIGTSSEVFAADVGSIGETVVALGSKLAPGKTEIDARGKLVLPGGVDAHAHIEQLSAAGIMNADTFETATRSAAFGGTTSVISFAAQHVGMDACQVVGDYTALAARGAIIDYAFHVIIADVTDKVIAEDIPALVAQGFSSIKIFMTYDRLRVEDEKLLDILAAARAAEALVCVHAENHGVISWMVKRLIAKGFTAPKYHSVSHPRP